MAAVRSRDSFLQYFGLKDLRISLILVKISGSNIEKYNYSP